MLEIGINSTIWGQRPNKLKIKKEYFNINIKKNVPSNQFKFNTIQ